MNIDELKVGYLLQLNELGRKHLTAENPKTTLLILEIEDHWVLALQGLSMHGEISNIKIDSSALQYLDVISSGKKEE